MTQPIIEEMSAEQCRHWLFGDDPQARAWRLNPQSAKQVGAVSERLSLAPGGQARFTTATMLADEARRVRQTEQAESSREQTEERLKSVALANWKAGGGSDLDFEREWPQIHKTLLVTGGAKALLEASVEERRAKSQRTF